MERGELEQIIERLDRDVSQENAQVKILQYGGGPDESRMVANKAGYLRFGVEMLRAAVAETREKAVLNVDVSYLFHADSDTQIDDLERDEGLEPYAGQANWRSRLGRTGCIVGFFALALCALVGLGVIIRVVSGLVFGK